MEQAAAGCRPRAALAEAVDTSRAESAGGLAQGVHEVLREGGELAGHAERLLGPGVSAEERAGHAVHSESTVPKLRRVVAGTWCSGEGEA
jgi:hypothetical protein